MGGGTVLLLFRRSGSSPPPVAATLPGAIQDRFAALPVFDFVTGGLTYGVAVDAPGDTYAVFLLLSDVPHFTTGVPYWRRVTYQFRCYGPVGDDAPERMTQALAASFNQAMTPLAFAGGSSFAAYPQDAVDMGDEVNSETGRLLHCQYIEIAFLVNRSFQP